MVVQKQETLLPETRLRELWQEARADKGPGIDPDEVLDGLERKYQAMTDAAGETG